MFRYYFIFLALHFLISSSLVELKINSLHKHVSETMNLIKSQRRILYTLQTKLIFGQSSSFIYDVQLIIFFLSFRVIFLLFEHPPRTRVRAISTREKRNAAINHFAVISKKMKSRRGEGEKIRAN